MRRIVLSISCIALLAALWGLWQYRYERTQGFPVWRLIDIRENAPPVPGIEWLGSEDHPLLRVTADAKKPRIAAVFEIPGASAVELLHLKFRLKAYSLKRGKELWEDGRFIVDWHEPKGGQRMKPTPVASIVGDAQNELADIVIETSGDAAIPALRLENLGISGAFELSELEISVVHERWLWKTGKWFLVIAWLAWGFFVIRSWPGIRRWRALAGSAIWLVACLNFVVPGPWKIQKPMGENFHLGTQTAILPAAKATPSQAEIKVGVSPAEGKMIIQGSLILKVKIMIAQARPLLHALLLFFPALAMMFLIGNKPALRLSIMLAIAIESAQAVFGYGFDWIDIVDLTCDAAGIWLATWCYVRLNASRSSKGGALPPGAQPKESERKAQA